MKLCILGQCKGGNAALWFNLFNNHLSEFPEIEELVYICRNENHLISKFKTINLYGKRWKTPFLYKVYCKFFSLIGRKLFFKIYFKIKKFDIVHIQGNYTPELNNSLIECVNSKIIVNMYGSDFYQNWKKNLLSEKDKSIYLKVLDRADYITCNWSTTLNDFVSEFPQYQNKTLFIPWGVDGKWFGSDKNKYNLRKNDDEILLLCARGLYSYNNVDMVVEAFCQAFLGDHKYKLLLVTGYANEPKTVKLVTSIIEKNCAWDQITLIVDEWIYDKEMMQIYEKADYNICFGSTDQLTISIVYGFLKMAKNILSPLPNYKDLAKMGYESVDIIPEISIEALEKHFKSQLKLDDVKLTADRERAMNDFDFKKNFKKYISLYKGLR